MWRGGLGAAYPLPAFRFRCLTSRTMLRFHIPLIKPDVPISSIRLSDRIHHQLTEGLATKSRSTPSFPNTTRSEYLAVPSEGTLWRRLRNTLTDW